MQNFVVIYLSSANVLRCAKLPDSSSACRDLLSRLAGNSYELHTPAEYVRMHAWLTLQVINEMGATRFDVAVRYSQFASSILYQLALPRVLAASRPVVCVVCVNWPAYASHAGR